MFFSPLLQTEQSGSLLMTFLPFVLIIAIFYFFIIRPQNKKQKETERMIAALKKGDKVVTIGGIHGTVTSTKEQTVVIRVDDNAKIEFNRSAIATVVTDKKAVEKKSSSKKSDAKADEAKVEETKDSVEENSADEK